jgi:hypothetical protein
MCFMFVYWGIGIHLSYLMLERTMSPNPSGIAIPQVNVNAMRRAFPWPDKVFRTIELLPQYQAAATCFAPLRQHHYALQRDIEMAMKGAFTFDRTRDRPESEVEFTADRELMYQTHELLFKHLYASAQVDTFRLHGIHNDPHARSTTSTTSANFATPFEKEPFYFLKRHPVRCGLMKHHLYARLHELRFAGKNNLANITWLAHLYVARKWLDPDAPVWPDMEFVLARQGSDYLFNGPAPTTLAESLHKLKKRHRRNTYRY